MAEIKNFMLGLIVTILLIGLISEMGLRAGTLWDKDLRDGEINLYNRCIGFAQGVLIVVLIIAIIIFVFVIAEPLSYLGRKISEIPRRFR